MRCDTGLDGQNSVGFNIDVPGAGDVQSPPLGGVGASGIGAIVVARHRSGLPAT
jgi:hypothetical protein